MDFDLKALYDPLDEQRRARGLTWSAATREINRFKTEDHPIALSTIRGLQTKPAAEGDGVLQMLLWLGRAPESFVPGFENAAADPYLLPDPGPDRVLRWNPQALHAALNDRRQTRGLTWQALARNIGRCTPGMLTSLARSERVGFPGVMRLVRWLDRPAANFTRISPR
jgi:hypothetical protein